MSTIKYKKMSLFDAPKDSILVHACNAQGVWGSGIAKEFKKRFPESYRRYRQFCEGNILSPGLAGIVTDDGVTGIGCLITSESYGKKVDTQEKIIAQTYLALYDFCESLDFQKIDLGIQIRSIYSNKFNSGLFGVPWEETEKALKYFVERYNLDWTVCSLEDKE